MNFNNHNDFSNQSTSILVKMKQCYHNEISKECAVLSDSERANFFWVWCNFQFQKAVGKTQSFETFQKKKLDENVYQVERVLNVRKQKGKLEFEIKWMGYEKTTWEPKTNLQGEACEFLLDCIFSVLSSYILISLLFQCKRQSIWKDW